jgi:hypothetical protein
MQSNVAYTCMHMCMYVFMYAWIQQYKNFQKIQKPPQNSRYQKDDKKQVPFWGSTNIRYHHTKFSYHSDLAPSNCAPLYECNLTVWYFIYLQSADYCITVCGCESTLLCFCLLTQNCVAFIINSHVLINYWMLCFPDLLRCGKISGFLKNIMDP